jgi:hypothetical protein
MYKNNDIYPLIFAVICFVFLDYCYGFHVSIVSRGTQNDNPTECGKYSPVNI